VSQGWRQWVGDRGDVLGLDHYGASAAGTRVLAEFGFTADNIAARAAALLERVT
jgi:transketolase